MNELMELEKELSKNRAVKLYKKILKGKLKGFPYRFWIRNDNKYEDASYCVRYLIEVVLKWDHADMKRMTKKQIRTYGLGNMLKTVFNDDLYECMDYVYKYLFYPWNLNRCSKGFWTSENAPIAIRNAIVLKGWEREDVKKNYGYDFYKETGLVYMLTKVYNGDIYKALEAAFPGEYQIWELRRVPNGYWTNETIGIAIRWMIEEVLHWDKEDVENKINKSVFSQNGLGGMLYNKCSNSPYIALNIAYPNKYKITDLKRVSKNYWTKETAKLAIKNMIESELNYTEEDIKSKLSRSVLKENGYLYLLNKFFEGDIYMVVNEIYPGKFKRCQLKNIYEKRETETLLEKQIQWYD